MKEETESFFTWLTTPPDGAINNVPPQQQQSSKPKPKKQQSSSSSPTKKKQQPPSPTKAKEFGKKIPGERASSNHSSDTSSTVATAMSYDSSVDDFRHDDFDDTEAHHTIDHPSHIPTPQTLEFEITDVLQPMEDAWGGLQQGLKGLLMEVTENRHHHHAKSSKPTVKTATTTPPQSPNSSKTNSSSPSLGAEYWKRKLSPKLLGEGSRHDRQRIEEKIVREMKKKQQSHRCRRGRRVRPPSPPFFFDKDDNNDENNNNNDNQYQTDDDDDYRQDDSCCKHGQSPQSRRQSPSPTSLHTEHRDESDAATDCSDVDADPITVTTTTKQQQQQQQQHSKTKTKAPPPPPLQQQWLVHNSLNLHHSRSSIRILEDNGQ